jgi:hypothetical protein
MLHVNPNVYVSGRLHHKKLMEGRGMGSVLLNKGGAGSGSSYSSIEDYTSTTGNKIQGMGLGEKAGLGGTGLGAKLSKLVVKPLTKKPKNIQFTL